MTQTRRFQQCDVFTNTPTRGNALAVVIDGDGLSDDTMQSFARWTNLAETTFICRPTLAKADYRVRIFTPGREMSFAGHPTLGSCMTWLRTGATPQQAGLVRQECAIGLVDIDISGDRPAFVAPPTTIQPMDPAECARITSRLKIPRDAIRATATLDNGPVWQMFELDRAQTVLDLDATLVRWPEFKAMGLFARQPAGADTDYEVRMLAPSSGMTEDPITGSLNAALACWLRAEGRLETPIVMAQGTQVGRFGRVHITPYGPETTLIGGDVQFLVEGTVQL